MNSSKPVFSSPWIPRELRDKIADYLTPLSTLSFLRATAWNIPLSTNHKNIVRLWDFIFKDEKWIDEVLKLKNEHGGSPVPALISYNLNQMFWGKPKGVYAALLVNDWTGDVQYHKQLLFKSLREHEVVSESVVRLKGSGIILHIGDAIGGYEWIPMLDPGNLFRLKRSKLFTQVLYYTGNSIHNISHNDIGGINGRSLKKKRAVSDICSIKLHFRDGSPVYRVFINPDKEVRVINIPTKDENGKNWVTRWREAREYEPEWWRPGEGI